MPPKYNRKKPARKAKINTVKKLVDKSIVQHTPLQEIRFGALLTLNNVSGATPLQDGVHWESLYNIATGTQINQKIGNKIRATGIQLKMALDNSAHPRPTCIRVMIVRATNPSDGPDVVSVPPFPELFEGTGFAPSATNGLMIPCAFNINRDKYYPYLDKKIIVNGNVAGNCCKTMTLNVRLNRTILYKTVSGSNLVANGKLFLIFMKGDIGDATTQNVSTRVEFQVRSFYKVL